MSAIFIKSDGTLIAGHTHKQLAEQFNCDTDYLVSIGFIRINVNNDFMNIQFKLNVSCHALLTLFSFGSNYLRRSDKFFIIVPEVPFKTSTINSIQDLKNFCLETKKERNCCICKNCKLFS
jgi:hypothetical protein